MKWSPTLHLLTIISGIAGSLAILGAWFAGEGGKVLGLSETHLFSDATVLLLLSISLAIGVLIHRDQEKERK